MTREANLFDAEKLAVGNHWFTLVDGDVYFGDLHGDGRPMLTGAAPLPPLPQSPSPEDYESVQWQAEVDAAQRLLRGPQRVLRAVQKLQANLQEIEFDLHPVDLLRLAEPSYHDEAMEILGEWMSGVDEQAHRDIIEVMDAITERDYSPLEPAQVAFLEKLLLAEINEAADHIVHHKPYRQDGAAPDKHTTSHAQLRKLFGRHDSPSRTLRTSARADRLFPTAYPRVPLPSFASVDWVEQSVVHAMVEGKLTLDVNALVQALLASHDVWGTLLEQVPKRSVREGIACRLLEFEEFMNTEGGPGWTMLDRVTSALDGWLETANLHERSSWTPLQELHPSDWRREFPDRAPLDVQIPFGWLDHSSADDGCAKFKNGEATLYVQFPGISGGIRVPGGPASPARFLVAPRARASRHELYASDNWLNVLTYIELNDCVIFERRRRTTREVEC